MVVKLVIRTRTGKHSNHSRSNQYSKYKHLNDLKSWHDTAVCPRGIWRGLSCWPLALYFDHSQASQLLLVLHPTWIWLLSIFSTVSEALEISQRQDVERTLVTLNRQVVCGTSFSQAYGWIGCQIWVTTKPFTSGEPGKVLICLPSTPRHFLRIF